MRHLIILIFLILPWFSYSQNLVVEQTRDKELFLGVWNHLAYSYGKIDCQEIQINCSNGTVVQDSCSIIVTPEYVGRLTLNFYTLNNGDSLILESKHYVVSKLRNPEPQLFKRSSGKLSANAISKAQVYAENIEWYWIGCGPAKPVNEFKIIAYRNESIVGFVINTESKMTDESKELLKSLLPGDKVMFFDIIGLNYYEETVRLKSMHFEIN